ncbi:MAG TPA: protein kinase [Gemmataceae bacterium]|nr:protein kinase [Gemmataceae bacterium]
MLTIQQRVRLLSPADRREYESLAERFESAWGRATNSVPEIAPFLPADGPVRLPLLVHLAKCDLELRRRLVEPCRLEEYQKSFPDLAADPSALLELLLCEYRVSRADGARPEDFSRRFPEIAEPFLAAAAELPPPREWAPPADYEVDREPIGRGGWGVVFRAKHKRRERYEAIKIVDPRAPRGRRDKDLRDRIQRLREEIPIAARLNHPNIVRLFFDGESNGHPFFVMEFCGGGNLKERLAGRRMAPSEAAALVTTLAKAVDAVHHFGLIHRDLKPSNVLFGDNDVPKIADFGLALSRVEGEDDLIPCDAAGTPAYMAPEQIDPSRGPIDPRTDVYGLGGTLFECLTGHPPFRAGSSSDVLRRVLHDPPAAPRSLNPNVPLDLEAVCLRCLAKAPKQRYGSALELAGDLDRFLTGAPVVARRQLPARLAWHWIKTHPITVLILVVLLSALGAYGKVHTDEVAREIQQAKLERAHAESLADSRKRQLEAEQSKEHAARVAAARQRARRGDWVNALPEFDRAIFDNEPDMLHLRVERLVGYFALNRTADLIREMDALDRIGGGDEIVTPLKLTRAAWLLCDTGRQKEGRALAREALRDRRHLSEADRYFAEGLAAERVGTALRAFRRAVEHDPLHYLAATSYAVALAAVGKLQEARRQAIFLHGVFPYSPFADLAEAMVALIEGNAEELKKSLKAMAAKFPPDYRPAAARLETFLFTILELEALSIKLSAGEGRSLLDSWRLTVLLARAQRAGALPNPEPLALPIPAVGLYLMRLLDIVRAYMEVGRAVQSGSVAAATLARLRALNEDAPDAGLLLLTAVVYLRIAVDPINRGDVKAARVNIQEAADLCAASMQAPSLIPRSAVSYLARGMGVVADMALLKLIRQPDPAHLRRVRESLHLLIAEGEKWGKLRQPLLGFIIQMTTVPLTPAQCADWSLTDPTGKGAFHKRMNDLAALSRALLDDWEIDEPKNPEIGRLREKLAKWASSSGIYQQGKKMP